MKAAVYHGKKDLRVLDVPQPTISDDEILVKVDACAVCGTDMRTYNHGHKTIESGRILGHEFCGSIVENGHKDSTLSIGDRVVMYIVMPCGVCKYCQNGKQNMCTNRTTLSYHHDGAFAEYVKIPAKAVTRNQLYKVPEHIPSEHAALSEPLGCVLNAHGRLNIDYRDTVAVLGGGPIGIMHALTARLQGARRVMLLEPSAERLEMAKKFGFDDYIQIDREKSHHEAVAKATDGFGPDVVIVACSVAAAQVDALEIAGKQARVEFFGGLPKDNPISPVDANLIHYKELTISGSYSEKPSDFEAAQALIMSGRFPAGDVITHELALDDINESFGMMAGGSSKFVLNHNHSF